MAVDVFAKEDALRPRFGGEVALALFHDDLAGRGFAGGARPGPDQLDGEKVARKREALLGDAGHGEGVKGYFKCVFHVFIARTRDHENRRGRRIAQARLRATRRLFA